MNEPNIPGSETIEKTRQGQGGYPENEKKEVFLSVVNSGRNKKGDQRYQVTIRFANDSCKKVSRSDYVKMELNKKMQRLYFITADKKVGFKISQPGSVNQYKKVQFTCRDKKYWDSISGAYDLLKDHEYGFYYIDLIQGGENE